MSNVPVDAPQSTPCFAIYRQHPEENGGNEYFFSALHHNETRIGPHERAVKGVFMPDGAPTGPGWRDIGAHSPPTDLVVDGNASREVTRKVLVTNNLAARNRAGQMSHAWFAMPVWESGTKQWVAFNDSMNKIVGITHWMDPLNADTPI